MHEETDNASDAKVVFVIWLILLQISIMSSVIIILSWKHFVVMIISVILLPIVMIIMSVEL